jgi:hypothetical protein
VPTALDNSQRTPRKLLPAVVRRILYALRVVAFSLKSPASVIA